MAPAEKTESPADTRIADRDAGHHEGINSGVARGFSSPVLGDKNTPSTPHRITSFASVGGWVINR